MTDHALDAETVIKDYRLGVVAEPVKGDERFTGCLAIPYLTPAGVRSMKYRRINREQGQAKYDQRSGQRTRLYNSRAYFLAGDTIGLAEGELDAIAATVHLGLPTMGVPGAQQWKGNAQIWGLVFRDFQRVVIFADGDQAGRNFALQVSETVGWRAQVVECEAGEDVASTIAGGQITKLGTAIYDK